MDNTETEINSSRRNSILYFLCEGDVMCDEHGNHRITDGEIAIYADGTIKPSGALTELLDSELVINQKGKGHQIINLETLEEI